MTSEPGPVSRVIQEKLTGQFKPLHLEVSRETGRMCVQYILQVINESYMHNVPKGSETHFKVVVVSEQFNEVTTTLP